MRPDDRLSLKEAAVVVGRSVSTLRAWIRAGELEGYREVEGDPNSRVQVSRQELLALAARSKPIHPGGPRPDSEPSTTASETPFEETPAIDPETSDGVQAEPARGEGTQAEPSRPEGGRTEPVRGEGSRTESARGEGSRPRVDERRVEERLMLAALTAEREGLRAVVEAQKITIAALEARCRDLEAHAASERLRASEHQDRLVAAEAELTVLRGWQRLPWYRRLLGGTTSFPPEGS